MSNSILKVIFWTGIGLMISGLIGNPVILGMSLIICALFVSIIKEIKEDEKDKWRKKHYSRGNRNE